MSAARGARSQRGRDALRQFAQMAAYAPDNSRLMYGTAWNLTYGWRVMVAVETDGVRGAALVLTISDARRLIASSERGAIAMKDNAARAFAATVALNLRASIAEASERNRLKLTPAHFPDHPEAGQIQ